MTEELNENIDSQIDAVEVETTDDATTTEDSKVELTDREKQFLARAKKAEGKLKAAKDAVTEPKVETINKTNTEQRGLTMDDMMLVQQGLNEEEMKLVKDSAKVLGTKVMDAYNNDIVQGKINSMRQDAKVKSNTIGASGGAAPAPRAKTVKNLTKDEHREWAEGLLANAVNK